MAAVSFENIVGREHVRQLVPILPLSTIVTASPFLEMSLRRLLKEKSAPYRG